MRLVYDAAAMAQLVAACATANQEINRAQQMIMEVKSHRDWTCKEKNVIDDLMGECKNLILRITEDETSFLEVLKQVEGELDEAETSISSLFDGVESILSKILSIPATICTTSGSGLLGGIAGNIAGGITQGIGKIIDDIPGVINSGTVGTGGWISGGTSWLPDIGGDIISGEIWHGPIDIFENVINGVSDVWDEGVTGWTGLTETFTTMTDVFGQSGVSTVVDGVVDSVHAVAEDVFDIVEDMTTLTGDNTVISSIMDGLVTPLPICTMEVLRF